MTSSKETPAPLQSLMGGRILLLRDQRALLDAELAELYGVQTRELVQAVKRKLMRFPADFMFQLSAEEFSALRSQTVTAKPGRGGRRSAPYAFTKQGVAMLSSVLLSMQHDSFSRNTRNQLKQVFDALRELMTPPPTCSRPIGFTADVAKKA